MEAVQAEIRGEDWFIGLIDCLQWKLQGLRAIEALLARASPEDVPELNGLAILLCDWIDQAEEIVETGWRVGKTSLYREEKKDAGSSISAHADRAF